MIEAPDACPKSHQPLDQVSVRSAFPILDQSVNGHPLVYLDNAATTHKPRAVIDAISRFYGSTNANVHRGMHSLGNRATEAFESARERTARFINARSRDEIIFTRGTTEGINLVAQSWGEASLKAGDRILLTEMEHHSNLVPWLMVARRTGAEICHVPVSDVDATLDYERLNDLLAPPVRIFAFTHVSNVLGTLNPATDLCALARRRGVVTLVDAAQSAGHLPLDVQAIGCDFLAFSGHKMCAPTGIGVLYGRSEILESIPPWQGGGEMIRDVNLQRATFALPPYRFEAGTPNIAGAVGLAAAMDFLDSLDRCRIFQHDQHLTQYALERLRAMDGIRIVGSARDRAAVVSFSLDGIHAHDLVLFADQFGIALRSGHHCAQPLADRLGIAGTVRASFYLYNTTGEIDRLMDILAQAGPFLGAR